MKGIPYDILSARLQLVIRETKVKKKKRTNPFYFLLVVTGVAFCFTAFSFGILTLKEMRSSRDLGVTKTVERTESEKSFMEFVDRYGMKLMAWELGILAFATIAAMKTDEYWTNE